MSKILQTLHQEIFETATSLNFLECELHRFNAGQSVDHGLMNLIVQNLTEYPERCRHLLEDLIIERLEDRHSDTLSSICDLRAEHRELSKKLQRADELVEVVCHSIPLEVATSNNAVRQFLDFQPHTVNERPIRIY